VKRRITVLLTCFIFLIVLAGVVTGWFARYTILKNRELTRELGVLRQKTVEKEKRLTNMEKTLLLVYNISPHEAHYYSIIFDDFSQKDKIPWEVYAALIRIESNFNPTVLSPAKCKGLTQVKEETGRGVASKLGINFNESTLWNDLLNIVIGLTYFDEGYTEKVDSLGPEDALKHAIKRYCGGPGYQKINTESKVYVGEYKSTVWQEYIRLSYIYKGILYEELKKSNEDQRSAQSYYFWGILRLPR
jgi:hypothetical protein